MYVIFPADEVVYLSYGRLIYIPSSEQVQQTPNQVPSTSHQSVGSYSSVPSTSTSSSRSFHSTASAPSFNRNNSNEALCGIKSVNSSKSLNLPSTSKDHLPSQPRHKLIKCGGAKKETFLRVPTALKHKQLQKETRRLSFSDFVGLNREVTLTVPHQNSSPREESGSHHERSPKNSNRNSPVNRNNIFKRNFTANKISSRDSSPHKTKCTEKRSQVPGTYSESEKSALARKKGFFGVRSKKAPETTVKMATNESALRELTHPFYNEHLKSHNSVTFKLVKTVSDFTQQLGQMYEQHAEQLQLLVSNFRKRNGELRKERPACPSSLFHTWETLLQEVEIDSQALADIASILGRQVSRPLLEKSFYRKMQSRKVFTHRESYETIITKTEEKLSKCRQEYKNAYLEYLTTPTTDSLSAYFNTHNAYVQQLHATNGMLEEYGKGTLPQLLQELEEIYTDLCTTVAEAMLQGAEVVSSRSMEQCRRYEGLVAQCKSVSATNDLAHLSRSLPSPPSRGPVMRRLFVPPQPPAPPDPPEDNSEVTPSDTVPPSLKDELVIDRLSAVQVRPSHDALRKEATDLEAQIRQIQDALDTLQRIQQRSVEANLFNKANEIQEDVSMKRFDLRVAQIHLSAINAQKELFANKLDSGETGRERKNSSASTASMKNKWLKAFKSLKTPPPEEKKNGSATSRELLKGDPDAHNFQEYTYKKITPCDVCSQVLRGHTRQGLKCRICKINVHVDCQEKSSKCQAKARLLRRQKSTSEIETRIPDASGDEENTGVDDAYSGMPTMNRQLSIKASNLEHQPVTTIEASEVDLIYQVLKQAGEISNNKPRVNLETAPPGITVDRGATGSTPGSSGSSGQSLNRRTAPTVQPARNQGSSLCVVNPAPCSTSSDPRQIQGASTSESSMRRRLFAGMKSLTGFGSRSRHGSPGHRSISLPEKRNSQDGSGNRPFGQPLCLGPDLENGSKIETARFSASPTASKIKLNPQIKKGGKTKRTNAIQS